MTKRVLEIERLVADDLEGDGAVVEAVAAENLDGLDERGARGLVLVEEVAAEEDEVDAVALGDGANLLEGVEGVVAAHLILLHVTEVAVRRHQNAKRVRRFRVLHRRCSREKGIAVLLCDTVSVSVVQKFG